MLKINRCKINPIIAPDPNSKWCNSKTFNPGVVYDRGKFHMLFTGVNDLKNGEHMALGHAQSDDGINFKRDEEIFLGPSPDENDFDHATAEDCRITEMDGKFYIAYATRSFNLTRFAKGERRTGSNGNMNPTWTENFRRVGMAVTKDWKSVKRIGPVTSEHLCDANVVLFPEKINNKYVLLHRPT